MSSKKHLSKIIEIDEEIEEDKEKDNEDDDDEEEDDEEEIIVTDVPNEGVIDEDEEGEEEYGDDEIDEGNEDVLSNDGVVDEDVIDEAENCYFQYDDLIDEYEELGPPTRVPDDERITLDKLTKYEMVRVLGIRAQQISVGAKTLVKNIEGKSPVEIAIYELRHKMTPFKIKRPLPNNTYEIWKISELNIDLPENEEKGLVSSFN